MYPDTVIARYDHKLCKCTFLYHKLDVVTNVNTVIQITAQRHAPIYGNMMIPDDLWRKSVITERQGLCGKEVGVDGSGTTVHFLVLNHQLTTYFGFFSANVNHVFIIVTIMTKINPNHNLSVNLTKLLLFLNFTKP